MCNVIVVEIWVILYETIEFKYQNQRKFHLEYLHLLMHRQIVVHQLYQVMYLFLAFLHCINRLRSYTLICIIKVLEKIGKTIRAA